MGQNFKKKEITPEVVSTFLEGYDPQERIVNFDYKYSDNFITIIYRNENDDKCTSRDSFMPFPNCRVGKVPWGSISYLRAYS